MRAKDKQNPKGIKLEGFLKLLNKNRLLANKGISEH